MKTKIFFGTIFTLLLIIGCSVTLNFMLRDKLNQPYINETDLRISKMQKILTISYGLTDYEARYYSIIFDDFSQKYNIPWEVYAALIRIESNFRPDLNSSAGASGIAQLLPTTAALVAKEMGIKCESNCLKSEVLNLALGLTYISNNILRFEEISDSTIKLGFKTYIGGPGAASYSDTNIYVREYKSTAFQEYKKLRCFYRGLDSVDTKIVRLRSHKPLVEISRND